FQLSVDVADIALTEPDGTPLLGAKRLFVDAQLASIWRRGVVLRAIELDDPTVNLVLRPDGRLNLIEALTPKSSRPTAEQDGGDPLLVSIEDIQVARGVIDAADLRRVPALRERVAPINVRVQHFTTSAGGGGRFHIVGRGQQGASLTLDGRVAVAPFVLDGNLALEGLAAETAWRIAGRYDRIAPPAGTIDLKTMYRVASTADGVRVNLDALGVVAHDLALRAAGADGEWIKVTELAASEASIDVHAALVRVPELRVTGADVHAWTDAEGHFNLAALAPPTPAADPTQAAPATAAAAGHAWRIEAPRLRVLASKLLYEDRRAQAPVVYQFAPLELDADGFATDAPAVKLALRTGFNDTGRISIAGDWRLDEPGGAFEIDAQHLPVRFTQPYLDRTTDLVLKDGEISVAGKLAVERPAGADMRFAFEGGATLANFHGVDRALREDFVRFGQLALTGIDYRSSPRALRIRDVQARGAYFKFVIAPDQSTNIADVLSPPRLRARAQPGGAPAAAGPAATPRQRALQARIDRVRVSASSANFADLSIRPNFATGIEQLHGTVSGLSSDPATRAKVELDGKVDRYAPVEIRGEANLLAASVYTNLSASFSNIELPTFTPYSGKFMGYEIEKGKLNAKFEYRIDHRKLDAKHNFVLDQLTLGDKVASEDAVHLPIKLAIALLKDRNGVIDIDLPVAGSLDDPKFRVGPLVWKALRNLLVKIATAPFALLGSLFGAGEEVRFVDFAYGSAALDAAARERLANVGKALVDRPQLKVVVPLVAEAAGDRAALVEQRFDTLLGGAATQALRTSDPAAYQKALDAAWRATTGEARAPRPERGKGEDRDAWALRGIDAGDAALRSRLAVPDTDLAALAKQRADAVRDALIVTTGLDPARVFVVTGAPEAGAANGVRLALKVE
ncbi:MAG: DUF748 domain-containing protein, partial [Steroidobacteraceae bacterium]